MEPHEMRVVAEKRDLDEKLEKLTVFFENPFFAKLPAEDQALMREQAQTMAQYSAILGKRIDRFGA